MQLWHVETPRCIYVSLTSHIARRYGIMLLVVCTLLLCFLFFFKTKNTSFIGRYTLYLFFSHTFLHARVFAPLSPHEKDNTHFTPPPSKWFVMFLYFSTSHLFLHTQYIHIYLSVAYFSYPFGIGVIIVQEAGGHVTDFSRKPLDFSCGRTLAHNIGMQAYPVSNIILTWDAIEATVVRIYCFNLNTSPLIIGGKGDQTLSGLVWFLFRRGILF